MPLCSPPCHICSVGGPVTCTNCDQPLGCHLTPTPMRCERCMKLGKDDLKGPADVAPEYVESWSGAKNLEAPDWPPGRRPFLDFLGRVATVQQMLRTLMQTPEEVRDQLIGMLEKAEKRIEQQLKIIRDAQNNDLRRNWSIQAGSDIDDWVTTHHAEVHAGITHYTRRTTTFIMQKGVITDARCSCGASFSRARQEAENERVWGRSRT
jgi:hypothetical protein